HTRSKRDWSSDVCSSDLTPFGTFLNERVLRPLGMVDTFKESVANPPSDAATSYNPRFAANPTYGLTPLPKFDYSCHAGSNGFMRSEERRVGKECRCRLSA